MRRWQQPYTNSGITLPPPFNQVPSVGLGHQVHHKYVVCGFNGKDPVVYCGSSNLALGGEQQNGDNLLALASKSKMAENVGWHLSTNDKWTIPYYDKNDLRSTDRELFA